MTTDQRAESERRLLRLRVSLAIAIVALLGWIGYSLYESNLRAARSAAESEVAKSNSQTLAEDIKTICAQEGKVLLDDRDLCAKAEAVKQQPTEAISGPKGNDGAPGKDSTVPGPQGPAGADSKIPGPMGPSGPAGRAGIDGDDGVAGLSVPGPAGSDGAPSTVPGPQGEPGKSGKDGADSTVPGPQGPPGPTGEPGQPGADGRGIQTAYCQDDGRWLITYTDGATSDGGVCRTDPGPPIGIP